MSIPAPFAAMRRYKPSDEVDVCIVGSGAGGGTLAAALGKAGKRVVVLEKGPWLTRADFNRDEIATCRRNLWVPYTADEPHRLSRGKDRVVTTGDGWTANVVGGGTVHMTGYFFRLHPVDFSMRTTFGDLPGAQLVDWPLPYAAFAPYYDAADRAVGVSGTRRTDKDAPPRSTDFPLPPLPAHPMAAAIDRAAASLGLTAFDTPRAVLSKPRGDRGACRLCVTCGSYGCTSGAKGSTAEAFLPGAVASGNVEVRPLSMAFEVQTNPSGKATGVAYIAADGSRHVQRARTVVLSATAVESARLLLASRSAAHPEGLGNSSGLVGRNLMFSTLGKGSGVFDRAPLRDTLARGQNLPFLQRSLQCDYRIAGLGGYDKGGTHVFQLPHQNPIFRAETLSRRGKRPVFGQALMHALESSVQKTFELEYEIFAEDLPTPAQRVALSGDTTDRYGLPVAHIHLAPHKRAVENARRLVSRGNQVLKAAGATRTHVEVAGGTTFVLQHGTARFGRDPKTSVLDVNCRSHDVENLYVVDGSFMPTSGGVPTTLTIVANALRVADAMLGRRAR